MIEESATGTSEAQNPLAASDLSISDTLAGPWVIQKVRALGELSPAAGKALEESLDGGQMPEEISQRLRRQFNVRLSELEVARYGAWLPHIRRHALLKAQSQSERLVAEVRKRMEEEHQ
jgi:hypothetical protein